MMNKSVALGLLLIAGFVAGAFIMSSVGREKPPQQDLTPVKAKIDAIADRLDSLEQRIADLSKGLEQTLAAIEANSERVSIVKGQLAAEGEEPAVALVKDSEDREKKLAEAEPHLDTGVRPMLDEIKEAIKKELKEENQAARREKQAAEVKKWRDWQSRELRKKLDDKLPGLAQKLGLDTSQEMLVRGVGEEVLRQIDAHWEEWESRLADATDEDWGEFKGEFGRIYQDAERQLQNHVTEEQKAAIMGFQ